MAVAPPLIHRIAWPLAAVVALIFLAVLALHGQRPDAGVVSFKPAGLMTAFAPEDAREVEIATAGETWRFQRDGRTWRAVAAPRPVSADASERIDAGLRLLRDSAPLRVLSSDEAGPAIAADYGLGAGALHVTVRGPTDATFVVRFGARNPLGAARYTRIDGIEGVPLLATYVAESWQQAIGTDSR